MDQWNSSLNGSSPANYWYLYRLVQNHPVGNMGISQLLMTAHQSPSIALLCIWMHTISIYIYIYISIYTYINGISVYLKRWTQRTPGFHQIKSTCDAEAHLQSRHGSFQPAWQGGTISTSEGLTAYLLMKRTTRIQGMLIVWYWTGYYCSTGHDAWYIYYMIIWYVHIKHTYIYNHIIICMYKSKICITYTNNQDLPKGNSSDSEKWHTRSRTLPISKPGCTGSLWFWGHTFGSCWGIAGNKGLVVR